MNWERILTGDCRDILPTLEPESVQCCVTSPPYWGLRDYGTAQWEGADAQCDHFEVIKSNNGSTLGRMIGRDNLPETNSAFVGKNSQYRNICGKCGARRIDSQLGLEATPEEYLANMVAVFRAVWRVLKPDGTLWVNMGDSYVAQHGVGWKGTDWRRANGSQDSKQSIPVGLKPKDLCMMPARLAMALQADGWYLRSEIVWHKPNPMPESVTDRPTKAHEMIYLLAKNGGNPLIWRARDTGEWSYKPDLSEMIKFNGQDEKKWKGFDYLYDAEAIREPLSEVSLQQIDYFKKNGVRTDQSEKVFDASRNDAGGALNTKGRGSRGSAMNIDGRNKRSVWTADEEFVEIPRWKGFDYFYDAEAIREKSDEQNGWARQRANGENTWKYNDSDDRIAATGQRIEASTFGSSGFRNKRSVWTIATQPYSEAHFATFPEEIAKLCILAGSKLGDTVLDPFAGSGTTGKVALELGRRAILIELNPAYVELAQNRTLVTPGFL